MEPEEIFEAARARARRLDVPRSLEDATLEGLRTECAAWFDRVPEPPLYPRLEDPTRRVAQELIPRGQELLSKCFALSRQGSAQNALAPLVAGMGAYPGAVCHIAGGRVGRAEREG